MGAFPQPSNPFLQGLMNSSYLALAIKQSHMEQQQMAMRQQEMQRRSQVDDLNTRMGLLNSGASPTQASAAGPEIPGGANVHSPGATINGIEVGGSDQAAPRPVDPGRTVSYGGTRYYVPTPAEQFQSQLPILQAQNLLKAQGAGAVAGAEAAAKQPYDQVDLPGVGQVSSKAVPFYTSQASQGAQNARQEKTIKASADLEASREAGQNSRSAASNATSRRNTDVREAGENSRAALRGADGGLTANGEGVQGRALAKLQEEEQNIHEHRLATGAALNAQEGETYINPITNKEEEMTAPRRTWLQGVMKKYDGNLAANQEAQGRAKELMARGRKKPAQDAAPPVPGTAAPAGRVRVKDSKGNIGTIPAGQLKDALASGYSEVKGG